MENTEMTILENTATQYDAIMFMGGEIDCILVKEEPQAVVNSMVDNIGLNYRSVHRSIKNDEILAEVCTEWYTPIPKYRGQKVVCMPFQYIPGWLFSIDTGKVNETAKPILKTYKRDCYKVLYDFYFGKTKMVLNSLRRQHQVDVRLKEINQTINQLMIEHKILDKERKQLIASNYAQLGLEFPEFTVSNPENLQGFFQKAIES